MPKSRFTAGTLPRVAPVDIESTVTGVVWKIVVSDGQSVRPGDVVVLVECMKMEVPVASDVSGVVVDIACAEGQPVSEGDVLLRLDRVQG